MTDSKLYFRTKLAPILAVAALFVFSIACDVSLTSCRGRKSRTAKQSTRWQRNPSQAPVTGPLTPKELGQIVSTARSFTGTPYMTGGTSRAGMDCSGLVLMSYQSVGRALPRSSNEQSVIGRLIQESELKQGDLVFFTDRKGGSKITHVGIITEIQGADKIKFIHATNSLGVVENNLKQPYWNNLFIKAVRVAG